MTTIEQGTTPPNVNLETGEVIDPGEPLAEEVEPETEIVPGAGDTDPDEPEAVAVERCDQETEIQGMPVRCSLNEGHDGEHAWQPIEDDDAGGTPRVPKNVAEEALIAEAEKKLRRRADSYSKGVVEILGDDLGGWIACELCGPFFPGIRLPVPLTAEQTATLRDLIGLPSLETMAQDPYSKTCDACTGKGKTLTGSSVPQYSSIECLKCHGKGWLPVGDERRLDAVRPAGEPSAPVDPEAERINEDVDPWGRRRGDPDFGRLPQYA